MRDENCTTDIEHFATSVPSPLVPAQIQHTWWNILQHFGFMGRLVNELFFKKSLAWDWGNKQCAKWFPSTKKWWIKAALTGWSWLRFVLFESSLCRALLFCCPSKDFGEISDLFQRDSHQHELLGKNENLHLWFLHQSWFWNSALCYLGVKYDPSK